MEDVRSYASITKVISTSGQELECERYLSHPEFSHQNELCAQLHYCFIKYASNRSRSKGIEFRKAIELFLDFRQKYNRFNSPAALHLNSLSDLNVTVFRQFERFLQKEHKEGRLKGKAVGKLGSFKHALNFVAEYTNSIPVLHIPSILYDRENKTEPFDDDTSAELEAALKAHTDHLFTILENRAKVHAARPYSFEELSHLVNPLVDRCNVIRWYQWALTAYTRKPNVVDLNTWLQKAEDPFLLDFAKLPSATGERLKAWHAYYESDGSQYCLDVPVNPFGTYVSSLVLDDYRTLKTLLVNGYPFGMSLDEIFEKFAYRPQFSFYERTGSVVQFLTTYHKQASAAKNEGGRLSLDGLLYKYYPSDVDMACLIAFLMLQTGWNKETVIAIDPENFEDALSGILSESEITIYSEKNRSQGNHLPYHAPKLFKATTDRTNKYSAYNLIKLAQALSEPLAQQPFDWLRSHDKEHTISKLFLSLRNHGLWHQVGRFYSLSADSVFGTGVKEFLEKYPVYGNGRRIKSSKELTSRLRPTWFLKHKNTKPLSLVALIQGHGDTETTDLYYDSSGLAMKERYNRLRMEQEEIVNLLKQRKFSGLLGTAKTPTISKSELTIFYFPGHEKGLWGCSNRYAPDWPGFSQKVKSGEKCSPSTSCLFCSRCCIFEDSLPYLIDRYVQIEALLAEHEESDFSSTVKAERDVIDWIIMAWDDEEAVQRAFTYQQANTPLFPSDPTLFDVLFDDSETAVK